MAKVASLGMYDGPGIADANDGLWTLIATRLIDRGVDGVPMTLDRGRPLDAIWNDPDLLLAQCCGYPLATRYRDRLRYVATPHYAAPGCSGSRHSGRIVVRAGDAVTALADLQGRRAAINARDSNTGTNLFRSAIAPLASGGRFFSSVIETGSHEASLRAVFDGRADVASIDTVTFQHIARRTPEIVASVRTVAWTQDSPSLPFVTSATTPDMLVDELRAALADVVHDALAQPACEQLQLENVEPLPCSAYDELAGLEREAVRLGYPELA